MYDHTQPLLCFRTSDQLLEELFGAFGANVNIPDILNGSGEKEKKSKKKKKRKHEDSDGGDSTSKPKKAKKAKKVKKEKKSDDEDSKKHIKKAIKKEKRDSKDEEPKKEVTERRKISIVFKDLKPRSGIVKPSTSKSSSSSKDKDKEKEKAKEREKEKEKRRKSKEREKQKEKDRKSREKKSSGDVSDVSLSDEETYQKMLEYHTSSRWFDDRSNHARDWDRDKYRGGRSRDDDRQ